MTEDEREPLAPVGSSALVRPLYRTREWWNANAWWLHLAYRYKLFHLFLKLRLFFGELRYFVSRLVTAIQLFPHRKECALYFCMIGSSFKKPQYMFKVFDKFHSVCWPNDSKLSDRDKTGGTHGQ